MVKISLLADCPQVLPTIASWIFAEWGSVMPGITLAGLEKNLHAHLNREAIPLTLVAFSDDQLAGTASLQYRDMTSRPDLSPWLAAVYVVPEQRNQGIGSQLVKAAEETARSLQVDQLYLFTPDKEKFYTRLGWTVVDRTEYRNQKVVVMRKTL